MAVSRAGKAGIVTGPAADARRVRTRNGHAPGPDGGHRGPSTAYAIMRACFGLDSPHAADLIRAVRPQVRLAYAGQFDAYWAAATPGKAMGPW